MANLVRNTIELVTNVEGEEIETKVFHTSPFIPTGTVYEAFDIAEELENNPENKKERELMDNLAAFIADKAYNNQFTKDELINGLHGPQAISTLRGQLIFITNGKQSAETKKFLAKKA